VRFPESFSYNLSSILHRYPGAAISFYSLQLPCFTGIFSQRPALAQQLLNFSLK
jgi:hypothetical protein